MLKIVTTNIEKYKSLPLSEQTKQGVIWLVKNEANHQHSLYVGGLCFGENINEEEIYAKLNELTNSINELKKQSGNSANDEEIYARLKELSLAINEVKDRLDSFDGFDGNGSIDVDLSDYYNINDIATRADIDAIFRKK